MKTWISVALLAFVCFFKKGECTISAWAKPVITAATGSAALAETINNKVTSATGLAIEATSDGTVSAYALVSQSPNTASDVVFAVHATTGAITITSGTTNFATAPTYTFVVTATDATHTQTATATLSVNDNPAFSSQQFAYCIADASASGTALTTLTASTSTTSSGFAYTIASGDNSQWTMVAGTGVIQTSAAMSQATLAGYSLVITATQTTPALVGTATVWVGVGCGSGATAVLAGFITLLMTLMAHLY